MRGGEADWGLLKTLCELPDSALLTTRETVLFLRSSICALENMRRYGSGPAYIQAGAKGSAAANQKCLYQKVDLLAWLDANKVSSVTEAAIRKGQL